MRIKHIVVTIGILSILISVVTWTMDLLGWVEVCMYCRSERTIIGILGIIILLPAVPYITPYISYVFGFFGAQVASAQIFLDIREHNISIMPVLAACALFIIIAQVLFINYLVTHYPIKINIERFIRYKKY